MIGEVVLAGEPLVVVRGRTDQGSAGRPPPDHLGRDRDACGGSVPVLLGPRRAVDEPPEAVHILAKLPQNQVRAVPAEVMVGPAGGMGRQHVVRVAFRRYRRARRQQSVLVRIAQHELAGPNGLRPGRRLRQPLHDGL